MRSNNLAIFKKIHFPLVKVRRDLKLPPPLCPTLGSKRYALLVWDLRLKHSNDITMTSLRFYIKMVNGLPVRVSQKMSWFCRISPYSSHHIPEWQRGRLSPRSRRRRRSWPCCPSSRKTPGPGRTALVAVPKFPGQPKDILHFNNFCNKKYSFLPRF